MLFRVPATSANLGPGFDSLGLAVDLANEFSITPSKITSIQITGEGEDFPRLRADNTFTRIFFQHYSALGGEEEHFRFHFYNKIPISRGLGSSSAVIIGAIYAAFVAAGAQVDRAKILNLALTYEPHPDNITPAAFGGFCAAMVESNKIIKAKNLKALKKKAQEALNAQQILNPQAKVSFVRKELPSDLRAVVVIPSQNISTHISRQLLPKRYTKADAVFNITHASVLCGAFMSENWALLREASNDRLHQFYRMKKLPFLFEVQKTALKSGALMSTLSGSGSSFFSLCFKDDAQNLENKLKARFIGMKVLNLALDNDGVKKLEQNEQIFSQTSQE